MMTAWEERQQLHNENRLEQWRTWSQPSLDIDISPPTDQEADGCIEPCIPFEGCQYDLSNFMEFDGLPCIVDLEVLMV